MSDIEARKAFPKILARYMQEYGMNQSDVARRLNVSSRLVTVEPYPVIVFKIAI